jgi:hypothetical protein
MTPSEQPPSRTTCLGWWEQALFGRQPMRDLQLQFAGGQILGSGRDVIGPFTFSGTLDTSGGVQLLKCYPRHNVDYVGHYNGEGTLQGQWHIGGDHGAWMIKIQATSVDPARDILDWRPPA